MKRKFLGLLIFFLCVQLQATIVMPNHFSDNMVFQRNQPIVIWGNSEANAVITIKLHNSIVTSTSDSTGKWKVNLPKMNAGGPYELSIKDAKGNEVTYKNIAIGEVWLASGQSNMEWALRDTYHYNEEVLSDDFPDVREVKIERAMNSLPQENTSKTSWKIANKETIGDFSAVAYYFSKKLNVEKGITIGIINSSWGGTVIESWIPRFGFENSDYFKPMIDKIPELSWEDLNDLSFNNKTKWFESKVKFKIGTLKSQDLFLNNNDSQLSDIQVPGVWENNGFDGLDGVVLLKKIVVLNEQQINEDLKLSLGKIDDEDITYCNGVKIGETQNYDAFRHYIIPKEILKVGENIIVIRVKDTGSGGGLWSNASEIYLETKNEKLPLAGTWKFFIEEIATAINQNEFPSLLYNAMIHPIKNHNIEGIIWYQGESNESRAYEYNQSFPLLINSWRSIFGKEIPFYYVQLSTFDTPGKNSNEGSAWAEVREAQTNALKLSNTGMVISTDIGNPTDIHPRNKLDVGNRLAQLALNQQQSPIYKSFKKTKKGIIITLSSNQTLIISDSNSKIQGFEIQDSKGKFHPAEAQIYKNSKILVFHKVIKNPNGVRYGWKGDNSDLNLTTINKLPISPFRTDHDNLTTQGVKYQPINLNLSN